jgi:hypothetical protein
MLHVERDGQPFAKLAAVRRIAVGVGPAKVMVHVSRADLTVQIGGSATQETEERDRVRTPREGDQHGAPGQVGKIAPKSGSETV